MARRVSTNPHAPLATASVLAALAVAQAIRAALTIGGSLAAAGALPAAVILVLPSLVATLPLGFAWAQPALAAIAICAANSTRSCRLPITAPANHTDGSITNSAAAAEDRR